MGGGDKSEIGAPQKSQVNLILARQPAPFDPDNEPRYETWQAFMRDWRIYAALSKISDESVEFQKYAYLDALGKRAREWARALGAFAEKDTLQQFQAKLETFVGKASNEIICDFRFWNRERDQQADESFDGFLERVRRAAQDCSFGEVTDRMIRSRIVIGVRDPALQRRLLSDTQELNLEKIIDKCRSFELGTKSANIIRSGSSGQPSGSINAIAAGDTSRPRFEREDRNDRGLGPGCNACGLEHAANSCPAEGRQCSACGGSGHYSRMCPSGGRGQVKPIGTSGWNSPGSGGRFARGKLNQKSSQTARKVWFLQEANDSEDVDNGFTISAIKRIAGRKKRSQDKWTETVRIASKPVTCKLDTGAEVSCIPMKLVEELMNAEREAKMKMVSTRLCSYFGDRYPCRGTIRLPVTYGNVRCVENFYVLEMDVMPTLSGDLAESLGMLVRVGTVTQTARPTKPEPVVDGLFQRHAERHPQASKGKNCIKDNRCKIVPEQNHVPVASTRRPISVAYQEDAKNELRRLEENRFITEVEEPTEFVSHIVLARKSELVVADHLSRNSSDGVLNGEPTIGLVRRLPVEDHGLVECRNRARGEVWDQLQKEPPDD